MRVLNSGRRARPDWAERDRIELLRQLDEGGCLVCRAQADAEHYWRREYLLESHSELQVRARVAAAGGFCPDHTRLLMTDPAGTVQFPALFGDVINHVLTQSDQHSDQRGCDGCDQVTGSARRRVRTVARWAGDEEVLDRLRSARRLCLPHLLDVLVEVPDPLTAEVTALALKQLRDTSGDGLVDALAGSDADLARRTPTLLAANLVRTQADADARAQSTLDHVLAAVHRGCCPLCRARAHAEIRYTAWLCRQSADNQLDSTEAWLCPAHLLDASALSATDAGRVAELMRTHLIDRLDRLAEHLDAAPSRHLTIRLRKAALHAFRRQWTDGAAVLRRPRVFVSTAVETFNGTSPRCAACAAGLLADSREQALLAAALEHRVVRDEWERGHGVCVDHVSDFADPLPRTVLRSRLRLLAWELAEAQRKTGWRTRNEPITAAETSWPRAIPLLCGGTYLGCAPEEIRGASSDEHTG
ncbi:hypothetical protein MOQ72_24595 [Saccharopolyspora sp. K220]|uniref:hypothetical protein n=1 Tax=Saccharopolyspora soli TaxID=2926618 RepID=UPI001F598355|nr:hypothetical protein [Saccharopolyspora soli]MCI2420635.1 hypothetical protein [Saccharopolyspora soli]